MFAFAACEDEKTPVLELVKKAGFNQFEKSEVVINKNNLSAAQSRFAASERISICICCRLADASCGACGRTARG